MEIRTCKECRRLFNYLAGIQICPDCRQMIEKKFQEVKNYLAENPGVGLPQILESCEVNEAYVTQWVKEERLELSDCSGSGIHCERCGAVTQSGMFCNKCKREFLYAWNEQEAKNKEDEPEGKAKNDGPRMRFTRRLH